MAMARAGWPAGWLVRLLHELVHRSSGSSNNYGVFFCLVFFNKALHRQFLQFVTIFGGAVLISSKL